MNSTLKIFKNLSRSNVAFAQYKWAFMSDVNTAQSQDDAVTLVSAGNLQNYK